MSMMCRPKWPFLLMCVFHDVRHVEFRGLTGSQRTLGKWGVTHRFTANLTYVHRQKDTFIDCGFHINLRLYRVSSIGSSTYDEGVASHPYEISVMPPV